MKDSVMYKQIIPIVFPFKTPKEYGIDTLLICQFCFKVSILIFACIFSFPYCFDNKNKYSLARADERGKNSITIGCSKLPTLIDPALVNNKCQQLIINLVYKRLINVNPITNEYEAGLTALPKILNNNTKFIFDLEKELKFSDGSSLTLKDVFFTFKRLIDPKYIDKFPEYKLVNKQLLKIKNAESFFTNEISDFQKVGMKIKNSSIIFELVHPSRSFLSFFATVSSSIVAQKYLKNEANPPREIWANFSQQLFSGAFSIISNSHKKTFPRVLEINLNQNQFNYTKIISNNKTIRFWSPQTSLSEKDNLHYLYTLYDSGSLDMLIIENGNPPPTNNIRADIHRKISSEKVGIFFNTRDKPFNNTSLRKAFVDKINPNYLLQNKANVIKTKNIIPIHSSKYVSPIYLASTYQKDKLNPQNGKDHNAKLLFRDKIKIGFTYKNFEFIAQRLGKLLTMMGYRVSVDLMTFSQSKSQANGISFNSHQFHIIVSNLYKDSSLSKPHDVGREILINFYSRSKLNYWGYKNEQLDELIIDLDSIVNDVQFFQRIRKIEAILLKEIPFYPIYSPNTFLLANPNIKGVIIPQNNIPILDDFYW